MDQRPINGKLYKVMPLPAGEAIELYGQIIAVTGRAASRLPAVLIALQSGNDDGKILADVAAIAAVSDILANSSPAAVRDLIKRIVELAQVQAPSKEWRQVDLDGDFTGGLNGILPVVKYVLEVQYSDFFIGSGGGGILSAIKRALVPTK